MEIEVEKALSLSDHICFMVSILDTSFQVKYFFIAMALRQTNGMLQKRTNI